ncbi:hypothetical protein V2J09_006524 [Rumex salicifolius]
MTGGSLGLRSSSYGSLQQQQQSLIQDQLASLSPPIPPFFVGRKPVKMMKDKERLFPWILMFAGRKKVGMLFICIISLAVFAWVLYMGRADQGREDVRSPSIRFSNNSDIEFKTSLAHEEEKTTPVYFTGYALPPGNPCESFTLPPPPADKKRTGPRPCPVCYLPVEEAISLMPNAPSYSPVVKNLTYFYDENPSKTNTEFGGSNFGGYPSLKQRDDSYDIRESMTVPCGFVKGSRAGRGTGYDIDDSDLYDMDQCRGIVVASAIFGNFDILRQPRNISETAKRTVCFFMFLDEQTEQYMRNTSVIDGSKKVGLWRTVVVRNNPYTDPRRTGKIPKLLMHRLFPNARYSIWMDGKLELVVDPYQILERFLWRQNASFAISRHYKRFDVFVEAEANKAAGKYENASIDFQVDFYKKEGLTPYTSAKLPITSDVPEGCVIIREHIPISNLFTCLWFHEVDRFTSRDQISFAIVRDKIKARTNWTTSMFLDCERRNFVVQGYHRDVLEHRRTHPPVLQHPPPSPPLSPPPPPPLLSEKWRPPPRRAKGRRRNRKVSAGSTVTDPS